MDTDVARPGRGMNAWERDLLGARIDEVPSSIPGLVVAVLIAWPSSWLAEFIGTDVIGLDQIPISAVIMAVLLGLFVSNAVSLPALLD